MNYDYSDRDFELLNKAVKRQTKGSCSCTCETRPISRAGKEDSENNKNDDDEKKGHDTSAANILRTGFSKPTAQRTGKPASPQIANKSGSQLIDLTNSRAQKTSGHLASDARVQSDFNQMEDYPDNDFDRAMWSDPHHEPPEEKTKDAPGTSSYSRNDKEKGSNSESKTTEIGSSEGSWGHGSRFPWKNLPSRMCFRDPCTKDSDCCLKFNLCDRSARICVDCWHHSSCISEAQCCEKYPYCKRDPGASDHEPSGRCVKHL